MIISVIIPAHNGAGTLTHCLAALAASSRRPDEVLVVDDGSTDATGALADHAGAEVFRIERAGVTAGPAAAHNLGARQAGVTSLSLSMQTLRSAPMPWLGSPTILMTTQVWRPSSAPTMMIRQPAGSYRVTRIWSIITSTSEADPRRRPSGPAAEQSAVTLS